MIVNKVMPTVDVLNSTKKSATMASTFSITSNIIITKKITKIF
jgi:hypothetical protein